MAMQQKQEQREMAAWPGGSPGRRRGAVADRARPARPEAARDAIFDIADFEAIADFAGLRPEPARAG